MSTNSNHVTAVLKLPVPVPPLLKLTAAIAAAMTGNVFFPNAAALITALGNAQKTLTTAETATQTRAIGTVAARNAARTALLSQLHTVRAFVQAAADADPAHAEAMITSCGMAVRKATPRSKAPFVARQGATSGVVQLVAKAASGRASYEWQWSVDGGKTWTQLPSTLKARTTLTGVAAGTNGEFRFRALTKEGQGDWSQPAALLVK
jgi:hypothetical protein